jgi:hypothetical protein
MARAHHQRIAAGDQTDDSGIAAVQDRDAPDTSRGEAIQPTGGARR